MKNMALYFAGMVFAIVAILHFVRFYQAWEIKLAQFVVPLQWSLYAGFVIVVIALWMFVAAAKK